MSIMNRHKILIISAICLISSEAFAGLDFIGEYRGSYYPDKVNKLEAKAYVIEEGTGNYRVRVIAESKEKREGAVIEIYGKEESNAINLSGKSGGHPWSGSIKDGNLKAESEFGMKFELKKIIRKSPTIGLKPPKEAVVLLPYEPNVPPDTSAWSNSDWKAMDDGSIAEGDLHNYTLQKFGDIKIHVEFMCPLQADKIGQSRSNSGLMFMGLFEYEVQILDSFGIVPCREDCGGVCPVASPMVNASLPPGQWQSYDATFIAPKKDSNDIVIQSPRLTVYHNGILIHDNIEIPAVEVTPVVGPIGLQDHDDIVYFRNIWVVELKKQN